MIVEVRRKSEMKKKIKKRGKQEIRLRQEPLLMRKGRESIINRVEKGWWW